MPPTTAAAAAAAAAAATTTAATTTAAGKKLTKKQQKALAHRSGERKRDGDYGNGNGKRRAEEDLIRDLPEMDDDVDDGPGTAAGTGTEAKAKAKGAGLNAGRADGNEKKRKRSSKRDDAGEGGGTEESSTKGDEDAEAAAAAGRNKKRRKGGEKEGGQTTRYIVFVGNMPFDVTTEKILKHFENCGEAPKIRLLTKKTSAVDAKDKKTKGKPAKPTSKGCAFLEFSSPNSLQKALRFHHTFLSGRQINVELSAGGGGKSEARREKIKKANERLELERRKLHDKYIAPAAESKAAEREKAMNEALEVKGWKKGSGGTKETAKKGSKMPKWMATGANAVRLEG